jgi:hypothetical protein
MFTVGLLLALVALTAGCVGPRVEIPTAHVGKVMTSSGLEKRLRGPSSFRLAWNPLGLNPSFLVVAEASDQQMMEHMTVFMPKDSLLLTFDCRGTFAVASDEEHANAILERLPSKSAGKHVQIVDFDDVYAVYAQQIVVTTARATLVKYDIEYVMSHREQVSDDLEKAIGQRLSTTPIRLVHFGLSTVQPPELIIEAQKVAKQREVEIQQAVADRLVKLTEAEAELEVAKKQQLVDLLAADTQRQVNLRLTEGVNISFVQQRVLSALEKIASSEDKVMLIPQESFGNNALMTAIHQDSFKHFSDKKETNK